nr:alpha/beta hydrolase [uncultured Celeribacter sp.]
MPLIKVNVKTAHLDPATLNRLRRAVKTIPATAPVMVLIHGFKFSPSIPAHDPHDHILTLDPGLNCPRALSWPRGLGFGTGEAGEGLCISLGWEARGTIWQAFGRARHTGEALARLMWHLDRPVHLLGHSLGARVALSALRHAPAGAVGRVILLAGADFRSTARAALDSEAGQSAEILNVMSRENDLFDLMTELALSSEDGPSRSLGSGLGEERRNWCDLQIDDPVSRAALARLGYDIPPPDRRVCHWSPYLRPGVFDLYRASLRHPERLPLALLQAVRNSTPAPRYSRLMPAAFSLPSPLSFSRKQSS